MIPVQANLKTRTYARVYDASRDEWVTLGVMSGGRLRERLVCRLRVRRWNRRKLRQAS